jgi:hypothetical protein
VFSDIGSQLAQNLGQNLMPNLLQDVGRGFLEGAINAGFQYLGDAHPWLNYILDENLAAGLTQVISRDGIFTVATRIIDRTLGAVSDLAGAIVQAIPDFGQLIQSQGPLGIVNFFLDSLFGRSTLEALLSQDQIQGVGGGTIEAVPCDKPECKYPQYRLEVPQPEPLPQPLPAPTPTFSFDIWNAFLQFGPMIMGLFEGVAEAFPIQQPISSWAPVSPIIDIVLLNGFRLFDVFVPQGDVPDYFKSENPFRKKLNTLGVEDSAIKAIPLFEKFGTDVSEWNNLLGLVKEIRDEFVQIQINQFGKPFVPLAYSGSGAPMLFALSDPTIRYHDFGVETAILVGAPLYSESAVIETGSLKTIINVYGSDDLGLKPPSELPHILKQFSHNQHSLDTINIELKDIHHTEYFYKNGENPTLEQQKASNFIARLAQKALNLEELELFLKKFDNNLVTEEFIDPATGIKHYIRSYVIDTKNIPEALS